MAQAKRRQPPRVVPHDLAEVVREAARTASGTSTAAFLKELPVPYQKFKTEVGDALQALVLAGAIAVFKKGKTPFYFAQDPLDRLDALVTRQLAGPLTKVELKAWVTKRAPGHGVAFEAWFKHAVHRALVHKHSARGPARMALFGLDPEPVDIKLLLAPVLKALRTVLPKVDAKRVPRERVVEALVEAVGLAHRANGVAGNGSSDFLAALDRLSADDPSTALFPVRMLRGRLAMGKKDFDALALRLAREGIISLHYHDFPAGLPESERKELVVDTNGKYYVGIARKGKR